MNSIKGIIFDADNTLYSTKEFAKEADMAAMQIAARASGKSAEELYVLWSEIVSILKNSSEPKKRTRNYSYAELLMNMGVHDDKLAERMAEAFEKKVLDRISLNSGVEKTLSALKKGFRLFIITDEHRFVFEKKLDKLGLGRFFDFIITSDDIDVMKPSRKFYEELKKKSGLDYSELISVGDSFEKDLEIPKSLGMKTVLFSSENPAADFCIGDLSELRKIANGNSAASGKLQAIILAAGESSRFWPLNTKHKSLVKIVGKPIIQHTIDGLKASGVGEIIIVQGPDKSIEKNLGAVEGVNYVVQPEAKGMGNALLHAEKFITGPFFVLNAERFDSEQMVKALSEKARETGAKMILPVCKTEKPWLYGIISAAGDRAIDLTEKPEKGKEPSNLKLIAAYLLPKEFFDYYRRVAEHMYAYEDALRLYMKENDVRLVSFETETPSLKYSWDLFWAKKNLHAGIRKKISPAAQVHPSAVIDGDVHIGDGTRVFEHAVIRGPTYIGKNCIVGNNVLIRDSNIEDNSIVGANADMRNCIVLDGAHTHAGFFGDTIIGENCRVGTGFTAANRRIDRAEIKPVVKGKKIETGATFLGAVIGDNTHIGVHVSAMPGVLIGANCMIGPATVVAENLEDATTFYTKFEKVIKKNNGGAGE